MLLGFRLDYSWIPCMAQLWGFWGRDGALCCWNQSCEAAELRSRKATKPRSRGAGEATVADVILPESQSIKLPRAKYAPMHYSNVTHDSSARKAAVKYAVDAVNYLMDAAGSSR